MIALYIEYTHELDPPGLGAREVRRKEKGAPNDDSSRNPAEGTMKQHTADTPLRGCGLSTAFMLKSLAAQVGGFRRSRFDARASIKLSKQRHITSVVDLRNVPISDHNETLGREEIHDLIPYHPNSRSRESKSVERGARRTTVEVGTYRDD